MSIYRIPYSTEYWNVEFPDSDEVKVLEPNHKVFGSKGEKDEAGIINASLNEPIGTPVIEELADKDDKIAIVVDDNTRSTPTKRILPHVLSRLETAGVSKANIRIVFALGTHRKMSQMEEKTLLGETIWQEYETIQHDFKDDSSLLPVKVGNDIVKINKWVVNADLRILIGYIKSHNLAGYSGGSKSILPGVSDYNAIMNNHSYLNLSNPNCLIGALNENPARQEMDKVAKCLGPTFIVNVVLDQKNKVIASAAGDVVKAHRKGVEFFNSISVVEVDQHADVVISCCPYPSDLSLYHVCFGGLVVVKVKRPIIRKGGVIIIVGDCSEGFGNEQFERLIMECGEPDKLLETISRPGFRVEGQWGAQGWADILNYCSIILVSRGKNLPDEYFDRTPMERAYTLEEAWQRAKKLLGKKSVRGYILPQAPYTIPLLSKNAAD